jgi:hypothetical protein
MSREPVHHFVAGRTEGRTIFVRNQIVDSEELAARLEPAQDRVHVFTVAFGLDRAIQCVLEQPVETQRRFVHEKIGELELRVQAGGSSLFAGKLNGRRREVESVGFKAGFGPGADVVARAAARPTPSTLPS